MGRPARLRGGHAEVQLQRRGVLPEVLQRCGCRIVWWVPARPRAGYGRGALCRRGMCFVVVCYGCVAYLLDGELDIKSDGCGIAASGRGAFFIGRVGRRVWYFWSRYVSQLFSVVVCCGFVPHLLDCQLDVQNDGALDVAELRSIETLRHELRACTENVYVSCREATSVRIDTHGPSHSDTCSSVSERVASIQIFIYTSCVRSSRCGISSAPAPTEAHHAVVVVVVVEVV